MGTLHDADAVRLAITRKLRTATTGPAGTPRLTNFPEMTAEAVMSVVGLVLDERDAEIRRLREVLSTVSLVGGQGQQRGKPPPGAQL